MGTKNANEGMLKTLALHLRNDFLFSSAKADLRNDYAT